MQPLLKVLEWASYPIEDIKIDLGNVWISPLKISQVLQNP